MDLVEINVIDAEALEAGVDGGHDVFAREAPVVGAVAHRAEDLGGDDQFLAARLELTQELAGDALAVTEGVHVGGVEEVDASLDRALDDGPCLSFFQYPLTPLLVAVRHHAEA